MGVGDLFAGAHHVPQLVATPGQRRRPLHQRRQQRGAADPFRPLAFPHRHRFWWHAGQHYRVDDSAQLATAAGIVARICGAEPDLDPDTRRVSAPAGDRMVVLREVVGGFDAAGIVVEDIGVRRPTLDEAFLHLTGGRAREEVAAV